MRRNSFKSTEYFIRHEKDGCPFSDYYNRYKDRKCYDLGNRFKLTKTEQIVLAMYLQNDSSIFRGDTYKKPIPKWAIKLFNILDNIIRKTPLNKDKKLYRFCNEHDDFGLKVDKTIKIKHNLTCTQKKDFHKEGQENIYVITPLQDGKTRAHNLFEVRDEKHQDEKQVDFLKGTKFKVTKIERIRDTKYKRFYLKELIS